MSGHESLLNGGAGNDSGSVMYSVRRPHRQSAFGQPKRIGYRGRCGKAVACRKGFPVDLFAAQRISVCVCDAHEERVGKRGARVALLVIPAGNRHDCGRAYHRRLSESVRRTCPCNGRGDSIHTGYCSQGETLDGHAAYGGRLVISDRASSTGYRPIDLSQSGSVSILVSADNCEVLREKRSYRCSLLIPAREGNLLGKPGLSVGAKVNTSSSGRERRSRVPSGDSSQSHCVAGNPARVGNRGSSGKGSSPTGDRPDHFGVGYRIAICVLDPHHKSAGKLLTHDRRLRVAANYCDL